TRDLSYPVVVPSSIQALCFSLREGRPVFRRARACVRGIYLLPRAPATPGRRRYLVSTFSVCSASYSKDGRVKMRTTVSPPLHCLATPAPAGHPDPQCRYRAPSSFVPPFRSHSGRWVALLSSLAVGRRSLGRRSVPVPRAAPCASYTAPVIGG